MRGQTTSMGAAERAVDEKDHRPGTGSSGERATPGVAESPGPPETPGTPSVTGSTAEMLLQRLEALLVDALHHLRHVVGLDFDVPGDMGGVPVGDDGDGGLVVDHGDTADDGVGDLPVVV